MHRLGQALLAIAFSTCSGSSGPANVGSPAKGGVDGSAPTIAPPSSMDAGPPGATDGGAVASDAGADAAVDAGPGPELPRGGRTIFPAHRLVGYCGTPGGPALGPLLGDLPKKAKKLEAQAAPYAEGRTVLPVFELIAVVVQAYPGADKKHRRRVDRSVVDSYLAAARQAKALLLLNIQPGHSDFLTEVRAFEPYLREPDVGVALDPEWAMSGKQKPGVSYGHTTGAVLDEVATYLSSLVTECALPEKVMVYHQVEASIVRNEAALTPHPGVVVIKSVDGLGPKHTKITTYNMLMKSLSPVVHPGFKLFFDEDTRQGGKVMSAPEVLALSPQPEYVMYE
jgi:hypothetical protein